jgi:hypothetical protein
VNSYKQRDDANFDVKSALFTVLMIRIKSEKSSQKKNNMTIIELTDLWD